MCLIRCYKGSQIRWFKYRLTPGYTPFPAFLPLDHKKKTSSNPLLLRYTSDATQKAEFQKETYDGLSNRTTWIRDEISSSPSTWVTRASNYYYYYQTRLKEQVQHFVPTNTTELVDSYRYGRLLSRCLATKSRFIWEGCWNNTKPLLRVNDRHYRQKMN